MRSISVRAVWCKFLLICASAACLGQAIPRQPASAQTAELQTPPAQVVDDARTRVRLQLPAGWELTRKDGELSTFRLDARTAKRPTELRAVAALAFNPYPRSTFSGALFYLSVTPHVAAMACAVQAHQPPMQPLPDAFVGDVRFSRGQDQHGHICTEARDEVYTALRAGSCVRFDLVVKSFCGGEVSGAEDLTEAQLAAIQARLEGVLSSVTFHSAR